MGGDRRIAPSGPRAPGSRSAWSELKWRLVGLLGKWLVDVWFSTIRVEVEGFGPVRSMIESRRAILAFWHSRILLVSYLFRGARAVILVSASDDGEIIARVLQRQGHETIRGSSTRGGLRALALQIKRMRRERLPGAVIPDGPQGPPFRVKPGVITLAKKTGCPIVPAAYSARKVKVFASWDRFLLPWPFTRCRMVYGPAVFVPADADRRREEEKRLELERVLRRITEEADRSFGHRIVQEAVPSRLDE